MADNLADAIAAFETDSATALSLLARLRFLADAATPLRVTFAGDHGLIFNAAGRVVEQSQEHREPLYGLRVVGVDREQGAAKAVNSFAELAQSGRPYTVEFARMETGYEHTAPWVDAEDPDWPKGQNGVYNIGAERWSDAMCCCNCSGLLTLTLRNEVPEVFLAILRYNEALRPAAGSERILCCGSLAYLRAQPVSASRWKPRLPRAVVYQHLAQQLLEPCSSAELLAAHPDARAALAELRARVIAFRLEEALSATALRPGDIVVAPPGRGHTGHIYILDRPANDNEMARAPSHSASGGVDNAWVFIESERNPSAVPADCGLPQMHGVRRNVRSDLVEYWNPEGRPCFVLRLL